MAWAMMANGGVNEIAPGSRRDVRVGTTNNT
jgi:hypothetical protein